MSETLTPVEAYEAWLPTEMDYIARKFGHEACIMHARLDADDPRSMHGLLATEWFAFQQMRRLGNHHVPFHGKSAQLQLAKISAGIFDKAALAIWVVQDTPAETSYFLESSLAVADALLADKPWTRKLGFDSPRQALDKPFEDTPLSAGIRGMMSAIDSFADMEDSEERSQAIYDYCGSTIDLGAYAAQCYFVYAGRYLEPEQQQLPVSKMETQRQ